MTTELQVNGEKAYIAAERAGVRLDNGQPSHTIKVEEFSYSTRPNRRIHSRIRLQGRWLARIFPPNTRVSIEMGEGCVILRELP